MRYGDLEMFLCGLELTHLLPKFQVKLHLILLIWENISNDYTIIINCFLLILWLFILMSTSQLLQCLWWVCVSECLWVSQWVGESVGGSLGVWVSGWVTGCVKQWVGHWVCEAAGWSLGGWVSGWVTMWVVKWCIASQLFSWCEFIHPEYCLWESIRQTSCIHLLFDLVWFDYVQWWLKLRYFSLLRNTN